MTVKIIDGVRCVYHHTASARGYVSRKDPAGITEYYKGRFGEGYKIITPRYDTTQFVHVAYYIREEG